MKHICFSRISFFLLFTIAAVFAGERPSVGIYYGNDPDDQLMGAYDWLVVDADQIDPIWVRRYSNKLFAYVSVGEFESWRHKETNPGDKWTIATNKSWDSKIADLTNEEYRLFLLKKMRKLHKRGYKNFFLDTLDSVFGVKTDKKSRSLQIAALREVIRKIRENFPDAKLIANRGVEVMDTLCKSVDAFAIESLYKGIDAKNKRYEDVSEKDADWIRLQLRRASECSLLPIVIDYLPPYKQKERTKTARRIKNDGFIPVISDMYLKHFPSDDRLMIKREVLILYDSSVLKDGDKVYSGAHLMASMPLEYMGFIPVLKDIKESLPCGGVDRYAGVIVWIDAPVKRQKRFFEWICDLKDHGQKILFINGFGFDMDDKRAKKLGLAFKKGSFSDSLYSKIIYKSDITDFELPTFVDGVDFILKAKNAKVLIKARNDKNEEFDAAAITSWGGYAVGGAFVRDINTEPMWIADPFRVLKKALRLPSFAVPDPTTQNGRRNLFIHIDGDGFMEKASFNPKSYAGEILLRDILKKYPLPHSVSIIEAEISKNGLYPEISDKMQKKAKEIFALPYIEAASHSFSHPFKWRAAANENISKESKKSYHLPVKDYKFSLKREIEGSVEYINETLLAGGVKKCELFFWTGDCLPDEKALRICEINDIASINGGDTTITEENPWLGRIAPFGLQRGAFWQIYVAMQNENIYTNDWRGPFWGYCKVTQTFDLTENPRRLKPLNIYYHFYSASKRASLKALDQVYEDVLKRRVIPIFTSEYIKTAYDFYRCVVFKTHDGFEIKNAKFLKTLRIPESFGYPDMEKSLGIAGFWDEKGVRYIHLAEAKKHTLVLSSKKPLTPYLMEANAKIVSFYNDENQTVFGLRSFVGLKATFYAGKNYGLKYKKGELFVRRRDDIITVEAPANKIVEVGFVKIR